MNPHVDFHALAPEIVLTATIIVVLVVDLFTDDPKLPARVATFGVLGSLIPVLTLAVKDHTRVLFGGAFVVDHYSLILTGFFLVAAYVTLLVSFDFGSCLRHAASTNVGIVIVSSATKSDTRSRAEEITTMPSTDVSSRT